MELPSWAIMALFGIAAVLVARAAKQPSKSVAYIFALVFGTGALADAKSDPVFITLIFLLLLTAMILMIIKHQRKQRKKQRENERLDELINHFNWHRN